MSPYTVKHVIIIYAACHPILLIFLPYTIYSDKIYLYHILLKLHIDFLSLLFKD